MKDFAWTILDKYFTDQPYFLTKHHLDSFNDFVINRIPNTIRILNPIVMIKENKEARIYIGGKDGNDIHLTKPTIVDEFGTKLMYPNEARLKNYTYTSDIHATIQIEYLTFDGKGKNVINTDEYIHPMAKIGSIPIMLHSRLCALNNMPVDARREFGECPYDNGGYFVVDGKEKVIVAQERIDTNRIFINESKDTKFGFEGLIRCTSEDNPLFPKTIIMYVYRDYLSPQSAQIDSAIKEDDEKKKSDEGEEEKVQRVEEETEAKKYRNGIVLTMPNILGNIPICILFRALGIESDLDMIRCVVNDETAEENKDIIDFFRFSILHAKYNHKDVITQEDALMHLSKSIVFKGSIEAVKYFLIYSLFPNVGNNYYKKTLFFGSLILKMIKVCLNHAKETNRDNYMYKRVDISGFLIGNLFRDYYNQFRNNVRNIMDSEYLRGAMKNEETYVKKLCYSKEL